MTLFQYLCNNRRILDDLIRYGVVPTDIEYKIQVFQRYSDYRTSGSKRMQAIENTADDFRCSTRNAIYIINRMEQEVPELKNKG